MAKAGDRISEYVLEQPLGSGAFGDVWQARHHVWHTQQVAVKLPHDSEFIRQLQREGLAVQGLEHPNIVRAIGFDPYADPPYLISELISGGSLRQLMKVGPVSIDRTTKILREVLAGLSFAHSRGIVHRDIKPENILLDQNGSAKLADFGFGQQMNAGQSVVYSLSIDGPAAQRLAGTLDYMAPEQRAGGPVDARADLYAVGVVMFELLTGERPAGTEVPGDLNSAVPEYLDNAFRQAYTRLERRYPSADAFAASLMPALPKSSPVKPLPPALPKAARRDCPRCHRAVSADDQFCMHCGVQLVPIIRRCSHCGSYPGLDDQHCMRCGKVVTALKSQRA